MENLKLPIVLVMGMAAQLAGGVWWVSQQAATIANLEETVSQLGSRMAIEDNVNLKRDVLDNAMELQYSWSEIEELWDELDNLTRTIGQMTALQQRVALIENELKYINRGHDFITGPMGKQICCALWPLSRSITHGLRVVTDCFSIVTMTVNCLRMVDGTTEFTGLVITMYARQRLSLND